MKTTFREVGLATFFTSLTTAVGFITLMMVPIKPMQDFALRRGFNPLVPRYIVDRHEMIMGTRKDIPGRVKIRIQRSFIKELRDKKNRGKMTESSFQSNRTLLSVARKGKY